MTITFLVYNIYGIGGTVRTVVNTANFLVDHGYDVTIMSIRQTYIQPKFEIDGRVKLVSLYKTFEGIKASGLKKKIFTAMNKLPSILIDRHEDLYGMLSLYTDYLLYRKLKKMKSDVVISTFPSLNFLNVRFVSDKTIKIGQEHAQLSVHHNSIKRKIRKYYKRLSHLTVLTEREEKDYRDYIGNAVSIVLIPNGIPKNNIELSEKQNIIISAGRFVHQKGYERLVSIYKLIADKYPEWELRIYGSGPDYDMIRKAINDLEMYNNIFLFPNTNRIMEEMSKAKIFALPSRFEPFGMVVIEALSVGLPVVSYDSYGPNNIIENDVDGFIVPMEDEKNFALKLELLMNDADKRKKMENYAKLKAEKYSVDEIGKLWIDLFQFR